MTYDTVTDPLLEAIVGAPEGPAVVAIGGGHGLAQALAAIQLFTPAITAIVGVSDDGGSSGRLRPALDIPPPGDVRRALLALTPEHSTWTDLFAYRFEEGDIAGHSLGNLMLAALAKRQGTFEEGVAEAARCLGSLGQVVPVANEPLTLRAERDGKAVRGQLEIAQGRGEITALEVEPESAEPTASALAAIKEADQIVLGPGSLFTSTIAPLRVRGVAEAVNGADAQLVFVCNLVTQDGETLHLDGPGHLDALMAIGGLRQPDIIIANEGDVSVPPPHRALRVPDDAAAEVIHADLMDPDADWPIHHPNRLGAVLSTIAPA